jgi:transposase
MSKKNGNRYSLECKQQIVDLYHTGKSVSEMSREYGISTVAIYNWIQILTPSSENKTVTKQEHQYLKKRIIELEMENEILKKATVILAKNNNHK